MLRPADLIRLPYTPDLTEGGIEYALRSLAYSFTTADGSSYDRLRRVISNVAVELALRRHLSQNNIPFEVRAATSFSDHARFDVILAGHRCNLKSYLISHRDQIKDMRRNPALLLNAQALVASDHHAGDGHAYNDIYIFAFAAGLTTASQSDLQKALAKGQPQHLIHVMPDAWRKPLNWNPLGALTLKSESAEELILEITGQAEGRELKRKVISLAPQIKVTLDEPFYAITSLHVRRMPEARIGIRCEAVKEAHVITPHEWGNLWIYGLDIFLAGYISYEDFAQRAKMIQPNTPVFQYSHTKTKNMAMQVSELKPLGGLFEAVKKQDGSKTD